LLGAIFACGNGLLHLPSGKLHPATPDYFNLNASTVMYDRSAKAPKYERCLAELLDDDREAKEALQDWFGYTLSPDTSQQKIFGMVGPPRSGKGTLGRLQTRLLGSSSVAGPTINSLGDSFGLEPLIPKSLAIISDVRIGARTEKSTLVERLLSISREDQMTVNRKFNAAWHGKMPTRIMFLTNELPAINDSSGAFASRLVVIVFIKSFLGKEDRTLTEKLARELSGILNWAIKGYRRLNKRGHFIQPKSGFEAIEEIQNLGSPVKAFVRDCCKVGPVLSVSINDLFEAYKDWCEMEEGRKNPGNKEWFGRNLRSAVPGLVVTRPRVSKQKQQAADDRDRTYEGIALLPKDPNPFIQYGNAVTKPTPRVKTPYSG
jgi:putative DNA primase/helicase